MQAYKSRPAGLLGKAARYLTRGGGILSLNRLSPHCSAHGLLQVPCLRMQPAGPEREYSCPLHAEKSELLGVL